MARLLTIHIGAENGVLLHDATMVDERTGETRGAPGHAMGSDVCGGGEDCGGVNGPAVGTRERERGQVQESAVGFEPSAEDGVDEGTRLVAGERDDQQSAGGLVEAVREHGTRAPVGLSEAALH